MATRTYKIGEAWLEPDGDGMQFCSAASGLAGTSLEVDLKTTSIDWNVTEIRMVEPVILHPRKKILTGRLRESAMDYIIDHLVADIDKFVADNCDNDDDEDLNCDQRREVFA